MKTNEKYQRYLRDLVYLIKERQAELKQENIDDDFHSGLEFGYHSIIELIQNQAEAFQIETSEFGFEDFDNYNNRQ
jgi:hypothetical protein